MLLADRLIFRPVRSKRVIIAATLADRDLYEGINESRRNGRKREYRDS